jgi:peptide/nickel transport system substrate-binding protein
MDWRRDPATGMRSRAGVPLTFSVLVPATSRVRNAAVQIVQDQLQRAGVTMEIQKLEMNTWGDRAAKGRFDAIIGSWSTDPSPASLLQTWTSAGLGGYNFQRYTNAAVDRLANRAVAARDRGAALALWRETLDSINADPPAIWLATLTQVAGVSARFTDVSIRSDQWAANLWRWRVAPDRMIPRDIAGTGATPPEPRR